jgi:hypothetical protein
MGYQTKAQTWGFVLRGLPWVVCTGGDDPGRPCRDFVPRTLLTPNPQPTTKRKSLAALRRLGIVRRGTVIKQ